MNIMAARTIAETVRTTLGPMGMDKMLVDSMGDVMVTNDGATILREMEVQHPIARMMIEVARTQEASVGDGTTSVVVIAGELLKTAEGLIEMGVHPIIVAKGYRRAAKEAQKILDQSAMDFADDDQVLKAIALTTMTGKGAEQAKEHLSEIVVKAIRSIAQNDKGEMNIDVEYIKLEKREGASVEDTEFIKGLVLDKEKASISMPARVENAKIALIDAPLEFKGKAVDAKINITGPEQLQAFMSAQKVALREMVDKIKESGASVLFNQRLIDNLCIPLLAKEGIMAIRAIRRSDMEKLARATGGSVVTDLDELSSESLGYAGVVEEKSIDGHMMIFVRKCKQPRAVSILIRGGTRHIIDEVERSIEDCLGTVPAAMTDGKILVGGGSAEIELARKLRDFATTVQGLERLAVEAFANALEIIPKSLAENAGLSPLDVLVEMRSQNEKNGSRVGIDLFSGQVKDLYEEGIIEPLRVKKQAISSGSELALMILRIDDNIASKKLEMPTPGDMAALAAKG
jgi:thermosome